MLTLQKLLELKSDIFNNSKVKIVRHKDKRPEYRDLIKDRNELIKYQERQSKEVFKGCNYIISFIGIEQSNAIFFGVFKVNGVKKKEKKFYYELEQLKGFEDLTNRVIIDWGGSAVSWHQWYDKQEKEIVQILPKGYLGYFPGLLDFVLDFQELKTLISNPEANQDWLSHLSAVNGIYLILDSKSKKQYIGAAYGKQGIWQRWSEYARTKHGGNKLLKELCDSDDNYHKNFKYSILQTLPKNMSQKEVVKIERLYMEKLRTRATGLNSI